MSVLTASAFSLVGLIGLTVGAEWLVRGSSKLATHFGVSPLAVGLTVVAYGTSAPEIGASLVAALQGYPEMTVGNVLGSNVANIGLILGVVAIASPLAVAPSVLRRELPFLIAVTLVFVVAATRLELGRGVGIAFILTLIAFNYVSLRWASKAQVLLEEPGEEPTERDEIATRSNLWRSFVLTLFGLGLLLGGAQSLVAGAVEIARRMGFSEFIIGVTLVAVGTSLPELATSIVAGLRRQADLVVGAVVGSNLFNLLGALGISALIRPIPIDAKLLRFEFPALIAFTVAMAVFLYTGRRLVRWEGVLMLGGYALFIAFLFR